MRARTTRFAGRIGPLGGGLLIAGALMAGPGVGAAVAATTATATYTTPGTYGFTVPAGVTSITATAIGADGGTSSSESSGGFPASVTATLPVSSGEQLLIGVGGQGSSAFANNGAVPGGLGGGGAGALVGGIGGGGGGGASLIAIGAPGAPFGDLLVAGGGGGAGSGSASNGANADSASPGGAGAGTQNAGGAGGAGTNATGGSGTFGFGGSAVGTGFFIGGGGGGGYYGGGAGGSGGGGAPADGGGGGGGSSYITPGATIIAPPSTDFAAQNGEVIFTYDVPTADESTHSITFDGTEPQGVAGPAQPLTIANNGSAPLAVTGVQLGGADPDDYLIDNKCGQLVAPGSSCQIDVRFSPQAQGPSTATLTVSTNAPTAPPSVTLSGTGGPLPQGPAGPQGAPGATGATGPRGPAGTIVCRNTVAAQLLCSIEFAPGTYTLQGAKTASFRISRGRRTFATGTLRLAADHTVRARIRRLKPGRYTLIVTVAHGAHPRVLLDEAIAVR